MRRVDEPVEPLAPGHPPRAFRWRGRRYVVQTVLTHWVETGAWWTLPGLPDADSPVPDTECAVWRVAAGARSGVGVLDLCLDPVPDPAGRGGWSVRHVHD